MEKLKTYFNKNLIPLFKEHFFMMLTLTFLLVISSITFSCSSVELYHKGIFSSKDTAELEEITLLTYNLEAISSKEDDQVNNLTKYLNNSQYDFVLFQELFSEGTRDNILEKTDTSHFQTIVSRIDYHSIPEFLFQDSGLFLMSRFPRIDLSNVDFGDDIKSNEGIIYMVLEKEWSRTYDFLANKSVVGALFNISDNRKLFLFTTHVQALGSNENKEYQLIQVYDFIKSAVQNTLSNGLIKEDDELTVILAGDFNIDAYNKTWTHNRVTHSRLLTLIGNPRDLHKEFNGTKQEYTWNFKSNSYPRRFDYVFAYDTLAGKNLTKISVKEMEIVDIKDDKNISISDHRGISAKLLIYDGE